MRISDKELLDLYRWMVTERLLDEKIAVAFRMGKIMTMFHPALGQEAANVGSAYALKEGDAILPSHRTKVVYLMRGMNLDGFMAGMFGRKEGFGQGRLPVGSHMCADAALGLLPVHGCIGSSFNTGVGAALGMKLLHRPNAVLQFCGDGGSNRGDVHEGMNFAAILKLPVVFFFANNSLSVSVRASYALSVKQISVRAAGYGIPGITLDGRDVLKVYETVSEALDRARQGGGPTLIEAMVDRWTGHSISDADTYRTDEERAQARKIDPVKDCEVVLHGRGLLDPARVREIWDEIGSRLDAAVQYADSCSEPGMECLAVGVYEAVA
jgi:TPP-dependent pyruvate/acetoin dehydrogenase alpha subunit